MSIFDDFAARNQSGALLRHRGPGAQGAVDRSVSANLSPSSPVAGRRGGLADGVAAYKRGASLTDAGPSRASTGAVLSTGTPEPQASPSLVAWNRPDTRSPAAVDGLIGDVMRHAEMLGGLDPQARQDRVAEIWSWPYRGSYVPGSWGKGTVPELGTHAILDGIAARWPEMLPPGASPGTDRDPSAPEQAPTRLAQMSVDGGTPEYDLLYPAVGWDGRPGDIPKLPALGLAAGLWAAANSGLLDSDVSKRTDIADPPPPLPGFQGDAPDLDAAPGRPADPDAATGDTLIFPDGTTLPADGSPPPSEDQSDVLPQGTVLMITDSEGNAFDIDVSGAPKRAQDQLRKHLNQIPNQGVRDVVTGLASGGRLTTGNNPRPTTSEVTLSGNDDPATAAKQAFDDIVREAGGDPTMIPSSVTPEGIRIWSYDLPDGSIVMSRSGSSRENAPTNDVQVFRPGVKKKSPYFKIRYER